MVLGQAVQELSYYLDNLHKEETCSHSLKKQKQTTKNYESICVYQS